MRVWFSAGFGFALYLGLVGCAPEAPKTAFETLIVEGRALQTEAGVQISYPGTRLRMKTCGGTAMFNFEVNYLKPDTGFDVLVDGHLQTPLMLGEDGGAVTYGEPLDEDGTQIDFIRRDEAWQGDAILTYAVAPGGFCTPDPLPKTKLLFIGDSITTGTATESRINEAGETVAVTNARLAYARLLGDRLDAQVHQIAYGGRGVVRDWQGITDINNAPQFYDRVLPDNPDHLWDPKQYQPDIVSIMLGTNDFNPGIPDQESWTQAYRDFVTRVRGDYPGAQVFLISSPMTDGEKGDTLKAYVREVAESFGTPDVAYIQIKHYPGEPWDSHPNAAEHQAMADEIEPYFRKALAAN